MPITRFFFVKTDGIVNCLISGRMKTMYCGLVEIKGRIQLPKHRHIMPFEASCLASSCCGLWISHKFCVISASSYPNYPLTTQTADLIAEWPKHPKWPKICTSQDRALHCSMWWLLRCRRKSIITTSLTNNIALVGLIQNHGFYLYILCLTELETFWGLNVQKVSVYQKAFIFVFWRW